MDGGTKSVSCLRILTVGVHCLRTGKIVQGVLKSPKVIGELERFGVKCEKL